MGRAQPPQALGADGHVARVAAAEADDPRAGSEPACGVDRIASGGAGAGAARRDLGRGHGRRRGGRLRRRSGGRRASCRPAVRDAAYAGAPGRMSRLEPGSVTRLRPTLRVL